MKLEELRRGAPAPAAVSKSKAPWPELELFRRFRDRTNCSSLERCGGCDDCLHAQRVHAEYDPATESKLDLPERLDSVGVMLMVPLAEVKKSQLVEAWRAASAGEI